MKTRRKILHFITGLGVGGTETMLLRTLPHLRHEFDQTVCCLGDRGIMGDKLEASGIPVTYLHLRGVWDISVMWRFARVVRDFHPDILVTYLIHADLFGRVMGRLLGIRTIVASQRGSLLQWEFLRRIDRLTKYLVTHYTVQTDVAKRELMKTLALPAEKFTVIPNMVEKGITLSSAQRQKMRSGLLLDPDAFVWVCISRLRSGKGHEYLLSAFEAVAHDDLKTELLIVGDGEKEEALRQLVERSACRERIHFLGHCDNVRDILSCSDGFILPTLAEGMSNALLEAAAAALPIITTNIAVNKEVLTHEKTALLVPVKSSNAIEKAMRVLLSDQVLRKKLGEAAAEMVYARYSSESVIAQTVQCYSNL